MIDAHNQDTGGLPVWLERALIGAGALIFAVMGYLRFVQDFVPSYPLSLVWLLGAALVGAGITLMYWRLAAAKESREIP